MKYASLKEVINISNHVRVYFNSLNNIKIITLFLKYILSFIKKKNKKKPCHMY